MEGYEAYLSDLDGLWGLVFRRPGGPGQPNIDASDLGSEVTFGTIYGPVTAPITDENAEHVRKFFAACGP
jgi:hypothetical protein